MLWKQVDLSKYMMAAAPFGGPLGKNSTWYFPGLYEGGNELEKRNKDLTSLSCVTT